MGLMGRGNGPPVDGADFLTALVGALRMGLPSVTFLAVSLVLAMVCGVVVGALPGDGATTLAGAGT